MKITIALLVVAISCCFDSSDAVLQVPCLNLLVTKDVPELLADLSNLLCLYKQAQKENNLALYREFLRQLDIVLQRAGCTGDQLLGLQKALENVTDQVGDLAREAVEPVLKLVDDLGLVGPLAGILCPLLKEPLGNLKNLLGGLDGLTGILG
ncbi:hypothetical protein XELAEV_18017276mg [Xenopus laevis]|uniref:Uncharacterized protein n=1 Tax=Xenopus laevis TaxID=8355 RepID=A0A974DCT7_XENLA|nr:hypothetical protein XELAEV_18017276mg [Xenopus laevis]